MNSTVSQIAKILDKDSLIHQLMNRNTLRIDRAFPYLSDSEKEAKVGLYYDFLIKATRKKLNAEYVKVFGDGLEGLTTEEVSRIVNS